MNHFKMIGIDNFSTAPFFVHFFGVRTSSIPFETSCEDWAFIFGIEDEIDEWMCCFECLSPAKL